MNSGSERRAHGRELSSDHVSSRLSRSLLGFLLCAQNSNNCSNFKQAKTNFTLRNTREHG